MQDIERVGFDGGSSSEDYKYLSKKVNILLDESSKIPSDPYYGEIRQIGPYRVKYDGEDWVMISESWWNKKRINTMLIATLVVVVAAGAITMVVAWIHGSPIF